MIRFTIKTDITFLPKLFLALTLLSIGTSGICQIHNKKQLQEFIELIDQNSNLDSNSLFKLGNQALIVAKKYKDYNSQSKIYLHYGNYNAYTRNFHRANSYYNKSIQLSEKSGNKHLNLFTKIKQTYVNSNHQSKTQILNSYSHLLSESERLKDTINIIESLNEIALFIGNSRPDTVVKLYFRALKLASANQNGYYLATINNNLGIVYLTNRQFDLALENFKIANEIAERKSLKKIYFNSLNNSAIALSQLNRPNDALAMYSRSLSFAVKNKLPFEIAGCQLNIGATLINLKRCSEAISHIDSSINVMINFNLNKELGQAYLGKSEAFIACDDFKEGERYLHKSIEIAGKYNDLQLQIVCFYKLYELYSKMGNCNDALKEYVNFSNLNDSLQLITSSRDLKELQVLHEVDKKDDDLKREKLKSLLLEKDNKIKRDRIWTLTGISILTVLIIVIVYYFRNLKLDRKQKARLSQMLISATEEERGRISRDLHDDVGHSLAIIKSKINQESKNGNLVLQEIEEAMGKVIDSTRNISHSLYPAYLANIGLTKSIAQVLDNVQKSTNLQCSFEITKDVEKLDLVRCTHIYRILQECVNNTVRHARATALKFIIEKKNNSFQLQYMDNGIGFTNLSRKEGIGLMTMRERAKMINGEMQILNQNDKGVLIEINFYE